MKEIYRIQNLDGEGPYRSKSLFVKEFLQSHAHKQSSPGPAIDPGLNEFWNLKTYQTLKKYRFGFESLEQLEKWFTVKELITLEQFGFYITKIPMKKVSKIVRGQKQVMFLYKRN